MGGQVKFILLVFILAIFSFVNSEFNHLSNRTDQLAQVRGIFGLLGFFQKPAVDIRLPNIDTRVRVEFSGESIPSISITKIKAIAEEQLRKSRKSLGCQTKYSDEVSIVLCNDHASFIKYGGWEGLGGCYIQGENKILINLSSYEDKKDLLENAIRHECAHGVFYDFIRQVVEKDLPPVVIGQNYKVFPRFYADRIIDLYSWPVLNEGYAVLQEQDNKSLARRLMRSAVEHDFLPINLGQLITSKNYISTTAEYDASFSIVTFLCIKYSSCQDGLLEIISLSGISRIELSETTKKENKEKIKKLSDDWQAWERAILIGGKKSAREAIKNAKNFE